MQFFDIFIFLLFDALFDTFFLLQGLVKAVHTILPQAEHRQCARHIMDN